ncbi:MAG: hypothetical protein MSA65_03000 [Mollicutes bacterium]|nr:hypothetical protein [Mollicutes bacterium]
MKNNFSKFLKNNLDKVNSMEELVELYNAEIASKTKAKEKLSKDFHELITDATNLLLDIDKEFNNGKEETLIQALPLLTCTLTDEEIYNMLESFAPDFFKALSATSSEKLAEKMKESNKKKIEELSDTDIIDRFISTIC